MIYDDLWTAGANEVSCIVSRIAVFIKNLQFGERERERERGWKGKREKI